MKHIKLYEEKQGTNRNKLWRFLNNFKDDNGKEVRFEIKNTKDGLLIHVYGKFNEEK